MTFIEEMRNLVKEKRTMRKTLLIEEINRLIRDYAGRGFEELRHYVDDCDKPILEEVLKTFRDQGFKAYAQKNYWFCDCDILNWYIISWK